MAFGFGLRDGIFGKEARQQHTPSHRRTPKARNASLVSFGHVNTTAKLGVKAGLEHGRGEGDVGRLSCARNRAVQVDWTRLTRRSKHHLGLRVSSPSTPTCMPTDPTSVAATHLS